jgi:hypothetical protein
MTARTASRLGWSACGISLLSGAAALVLILVHQSEPLDDRLDTSTQELVVATLAFVGYSVFGALLVSRLPRNVMGARLRAGGESGTRNATIAPHPGQRPASPNLAGG